MSTPVAELLIVGRGPDMVYAPDVFLYDGTIPYEGLVRQQHFQFFNWVRSSIGTSDDRGS